MAAPKSGLGKGLSALISEDTVQKLNQGYIPALPIDLVKPNPYQPRVEFNPEKLVELADSLGNKENHQIAEALRIASRYASGSPTELFGEAREVLERVRFECDKELTEPQRVRIGVVLRQIDYEFKRIGGA